MRISYSCPFCGARDEFPPESGKRECRRCSRVLIAAGPEVRAAEPPGRCRLCGDDKFYIQKEFNQRIGCLIVAIGAALVPWTYGLSLAVCALLDLALYLRLPMIAVCYVCGARYHGLPLNPDHTPYDLMTAQTYEARSLNWRARHS